MSLVLTEDGLVAREARKHSKSICNCMFSFFAITTEIFRHGIAPNSLCSGGLGNFAQAAKARDKAWSQRLDRDIVFVESDLLATLNSRIQNVDCKSGLH